MFRFLLICILPILSGCSSALFFPSRSLFYDPAKMDLNFEEVHFTSYDGTPLYGWYFHHREARPAKAIVFYAHGNGGNISSHFGNIAFVLDRGYDFFIFDYRGYGSSGGSRPSPREAVGDTIAALHWTDARAKKEKLPMIAFGQSLGSALMIRALAEEKATIHPKLIVIESGFLSYEWAAVSVLSNHWLLFPLEPLAFLVISDEWAPKLRIRELAPTPFLIFHGDADHTIDFRLGVELYDAALPPKEFIRVPGGGHIQSFWVEDGKKFREVFLARMDAAIKSD